MTGALTMGDAPSQPVVWVTCTGVAGYGHALTYGNRYAVLERDEAKRQVRLRGDNGKRRWYPCGCFDMAGGEVPRIVGIDVRDSIEDPLADWIEVEIDLSVGPRRWCYFTTPESIARLTGEVALGPERLVCHNTSNLIVVTRITHDVIEAALKYIESQGDILACTRAME
jgi:hypothetical protein